LLRWLKEVFQWLHEEAEHPHIHEETKHPYTYIKKCEAVMLSQDWYM